MALLTLNEGKILVNLARYSIETFFSKKIISMPEADKFTEKQGVFVTLKELDELRGCIGFPEPVYPLKRAIIDSARAAAFKDPRFMPLIETELDEITIEVSVLTKPELVEVEDPQEYLNKIEIGKHGLIIRYEYRSGLLLPQVFTEYKSTPKEALEMVCEKAGLHKDAWKEEEAEIYIFQAQIFCEEEPQGRIVEKEE
jgi:uncharacterized protein